ncbi:MAG TPA: CVNH domain-containing protein [Candidatus Angelobacter sp.]|jgi:hypothetical protein
MRYTSALFALAIATFLGHAVAQEANPSGSYQQTCSNISVRKGNLYAQCQDEKGKSHSAKLSSYGKCTADIVNKNGSLECAHTHNAPAQPPGPYTETCRDIQMKGSTLHAVCKSVDGREMPTKLNDANRCMQGVTNINGVLSCVVSDVLPPGSYLATCRDVRWQATTLHASCNNGKDQWLPAELRDAHKCTGDIANHEGKLRCIAIKRVERR